MHLVPYVLGMVVLNVLLSNAVWWTIGSKSRGVRAVGRVSGAFFCLANLALALICFLRLIQKGMDWFYIALFVLALVFAFRIGGATSGHYP